MKKNILSYAAVVAAFAFTAQSCADIDVETPDTLVEYTEEDSREGNFTVNFECGMAGTGTRTEFHDKTIWWSAGDVASFFQYAKVNGEYNIKRTSNTALSQSKETFSMNISSFLEPDADTEAAYFSVYPSLAYYAYNKDNDIISPRVTLPSAQTPTATGFDPAADLLVSEYKVSSAKETSFKLNYFRMVGIAKMTIANLPSEAAVSSITFSAKKSGEKVELAGSRFYDLLNSTVSTIWSSNCFNEYAITLDYSAQSLTANTADGMTAYFCCYPFELVAGDTFDVIVKTVANEQFEREVVIPEGRTLALEMDKGTNFTVDMSKAEKLCDWFTMGQSSNANTNNTIYNRIAKASTYSGSITSIDYVAVKASEYDPSADYFASGYKSLAEASVTKINDGTALSSSIGSLEIDTEYKILYKVTNSDGETAILRRDASTDWFKFAAVTRSSGGIQVQITGKGLVYGTKAYATVLESELADVTDLSDFYTNTIKPKNYAESVITTINGKNGVSTNYAVSTDWQGNALVSGQKYVLMMSAKNERGETTFRSATAEAK